ncbi:hypothetical protein [Pseudomonas syringae]|uniref:hypothetical protein n=1 Tax=Pseudomonas syringae TaxID=317 RepID=UPI00245DF8F5|nr:hypothetical protein [Pseudomonas syringae]MDH4602325.1 hypothetical protein [Pseudomonas syringae pv. papulans]
MINNTEQAEPMIDTEKERQIYQSIPAGERLASLGAGIGASIAFGVGTESFAIGVGTFLALFYLSSELSLQMTKHRGCRKGN